MGSLLWNLQTQRDEYIEDDEVPAKLASGAYRTTDASQTQVDVGNGVAAAYDPVEGRERVKAGAQEIAHETTNAAARAADQRAAFDDAGDKALQVVDGFVRGASGGMAELPMHQWERQLREEVNGSWGTLGEVAAIATAVLFPESAIGKFTPLGLSNKAQTAVGALGKGKGIATRVLAEAGGGAAAGGILGTSAQVGNLVQGRPVNPDAIVDDIGLGALVGGSLALAGTGIGKLADKIKNAKDEVVSAARLEEIAAPTHNAMKDAAKSWDDAHLMAQKRLRVLEEHVDNGLLDSQAMGGKEWLAERQAAAKAAEAAKQRLYKQAGLAKYKAGKLVEGAENPELLAARIKSVIETGSKKDLDVLKAFDDYGTAVSKFDDAMLPTKIDDAHLGDIINEMDLSSKIAIQDHPLTQLEEMLKRGETPSDDLLSRIDEAMGYGPRPKPVAEGGTAQIRKPVQAAEEGTAKLRKPVADDIGKADTQASPKQLRTGDSGKLVPEDFEAPRVPEAVEPGPNGTKRLPREQSEGLKVDLDLETRWEIDNPGIAPAPYQTARIKRPSDTVLELAEQPVPRLRGGNLVEDKSLGTLYSPAAPKGPVTSSVNAWDRPGDFVMGTPGKTEAGFMAKRLLATHGAAARVARSTELGQNIQAALDQLSTATGGKLGAPELRALAEKLGVNLQKLDGPMSGKLVDLWSMRKLASALAEETGTAAKGGKPGLLAKALRGGAGSTGYRVGKEMGGPFGAGIMASLMSSAVGATGVITAAAGRFKNHAVLGMARVLSPTGRKALTLGVVTRAPLVSYDGTAPTRDFETQASQIRMMASNPDMVKQRVRDQLREIQALDPALVEGVAESSMRRIKNLEARIPTGTYRGPFEPPGPPSAAAMDEWHQYQNVTADRSAIFDYIKTGYVPPIVVDAMNEQHPDFMQEIRSYVLENHDEVSKAPFNTKMALSNLLQTALIPEAEPGYVQRQQEAYALAKQKNAEKKQMTQGAAAVKGGLQPTPAQMMMGPIAR